ncbi:MAG: type III-A CRISPR-associated protein Cas10/Csm1 [bacterium]|nr:type III-A CRISPR-associated protein Cas10/Csm1 [bacterium]
MEISDREALILAALLHDIGKFWQRTGEKYRVEYEEVIKDCCPYFEVRGIYTHRHILWSGDFVDRYIGDKKVKNLVLYHHSPLNRLQKILALANDLSLGELFPEEGFQEMEQPDYYQTPLQSIFSETKVKPDESIFNREAYYFPVTKFSSPEHFLPETQLSLSKEKYLHLWRDFTQEISKLGELKRFSTDSDTWYYLLKKYLSNIPAVPLKKVGEYSPDLSLFDHACTTAAVAVCLYDLNLKETELDEVLSAFWHVHPPLSIGVERFIFIGGEISDNPLEGNSLLEQGNDSIIKGKFLYLRLLERAVVKSILESLDLPQVNLLYSGGGRFYLIAPLTKEAQLLEIKTEINRRLSHVHGGELRLSLASVPAAMNDFIGTLGAGLGRCWKMVLEALELDKNRAFKELAAKNYSLVFAPLSKGGKEVYCSICGIDRVTEKGAICGMCAGFEELGQLGSTSEILLERRIALDSDKDIPSPGNFREALEIFGGQYIFRKNQELAAIKADFDINVIILNSPELSKVSAQLPSYYKQKEASKASLEFDFFPQRVPEMKKKQAKLQGVVRLDMDNLELIYSHGLGYRATLSRISTLSSLISIFFKAYLTSFIKDKYANDASLLWAGSNAVFITGDWDKVIEASISVREAFKKYTGEDGGFDLSAGLSFIGPDEPVSVGITSSRRSLNEAKKKGGNFAFLGKTIAWDRLEDIERLKNILIFCLEIGKEGQRLPAEILLELSNLYRLYEKARRNTEEPPETVNYQRWQWLLTFYLARMIECYPEFQTELGGIREMIVNEGLIKDLDVVINWAGLSLEQ